MCRFKFWDTSRTLQATPDRSPRLLVVGNFMSGAVAHRDYCEDFADRLEARGWRLVRTSTRRNRARRLADMLRVTWTMRDQFDVAHVDVFSGNSFIWAEATTWLLHRLHKPYIVTLRGGNLPAFAARWPRRMGALLGRATLVTTPSRYLATTVGAGARAIAVVPNAVDTSHLPFVPRVRARPRLAWVRAFHAIYNPTMAVDVVALLRKQLPDVHLTMVGHDKGDGTLEATRRRVLELGLDSHVRIVPGVPKRNVGLHLAEHDIFVNTTNIDNTPVSVLEAMSCGLPVVSTSVGGIPYLLRDEQDALLTPAKDSAAMATAVERIVADPDLARRLSAAGHELAQACDWEHVLDRWEKIVKDLERDG